MKFCVPRMPPAEQSVGGYPGLPRGLPTQGRRLIGASRGRELPKHGRGEFRGRFPLRLAMEASGRRVASLTAHLSSGGRVSPGLLRLERMEDAHTVVVGGMVMDVMAIPRGKVVGGQRGTTVPGSVRQAPGGVGRNIAQCIAALGEGWARQPLLISVVGRDPAGDALLGHLRYWGVASDLTVFAN